METSEKTDLIDAALAAAQAEIEPAVKDCVNPHLGSRYANLLSVNSVARNPLAKHGLNVTHNPLVDFEKKAVGCYARVAHKSGQWITFDPLWVVPERGLGPQSVGSAMTYLRRYTICAAFNISTDDDDAEAAEGRGKKNDGDAEAAEGRGKKNDDEHANKSAKPKSQPQANLSDRAAKMLDAFRSIGWTEANIEEAVGVPIKQFTDTQFDFAQELYNTQKRRQAVDKNRARAQFES